MNDPGHICNLCATPEILRWQVHNAVSHEGPCVQCGRPFRITRTIEPGNDLPGRTVPARWQRWQVRAMINTVSAFELRCLNRPVCWWRGHEWGAIGGWMYCRRCNYLPKVSAPAPVGELPPALFDEDGYPAESTLAIIRTWPIDRAGLWEYLARCWTHGDCVRREAGLVTLITCGWSGNESLVQALTENRVVQSVCWQSSERGGRHVYRDHESNWEPVMEKGKA